MNYTDYKIIIFIFFTTVKGIKRYDIFFTKTDKSQWAYTANAKLFHSNETLLVVSLTSQNKCLGSL